MRDWIRFPATYIIHDCLPVDVLVVVSEIKIGSAGQDVDGYDGVLPPVGLSSFCGVVVVLPLWRRV
jgi:hypothetical protein